MESLHQFQLSNLWWTNVSLSMSFSVADVVVMKLELLILRIPAAMELLCHFPNSSTYPHPNSVARWPFVALCRGRALC